MFMQKDELILLLTALIGMCLSNFNIFISPIYIGTLIDGHGFTEVQAGSVSTFEIGAVAVVTLFLANWLDRFSLRRLSILGLAIILFANLITFYLDSYFYIATTRILAGTGAGLCLAVTSVLLTRAINPDKMMAILLVVTALIMIIILIILGHLKEQWQYNSVIGMFSLVTILLFPLVLLMPKQNTLSNQSVATSLTPSSEVSAMTPYFILGIFGLIMTFTFCLIDGSVWSFSERSAVNLGISDSRIGLILAIAQGVGLCGATLAALIGDKISRIYPMMIGIVITGITGLLIYRTESDFIYSICVIGFSFGYFLALPYFIGTCVRLDENGRWAARANGIGLLGGAVAPFIAGSIITMGDYQMLGSFCLSIAVICLISTLIFQQKISKLNPDFSIETV